MSTLPTAPSLVRWDTRRFIQPHAASYGTTFRERSIATTVGRVAAARTGLAAAPALGHPRLIGTLCSAGPGVVLLRALFAGTEL